MELTEKELLEIKEKVENDLKKSSLSSSYLLDRLKMIDDSSRQTAAYHDGNFVLFYYYLGKYLQPKNMMELGFNLGLVGSCFLKSCKTVESYLGFQEKKDSYFSPRMGISNIKFNYKKKVEYYIGNVYDREFVDKMGEREWDFVIMNEEDGFDKHSMKLDLVWSNLAINSIVVVEYVNKHKPSRDAFLSFCESKNKKPFIFDTRYGTGMLQK